MRCSPAWKAGFGSHARLSSMSPRFLFKASRRGPKLVIWSLVSTFKGVKRDHFVPRLDSRVLANTQHMSHAFPLADITE